MGIVLPDIIAATKFAQPSDWAEDERGRHKMTLSLDIDGVTIEGLFLRVTALRSLPDQEVMVQLEYRPPHAAGDALCRLDWRPLRPHRNPMIGPKKLHLLEIPGTHHHSFDLNWLDNKNCMRVGNLPLAKSVDEDPSTFGQLLALVSKEFRISNLSEVPLPAWDLLL